MGKATIISGGTDGQYQIKLTLNRDRVDTELTSLAGRIANLAAYIAGLASGSAKDAAILDKTALEKRVQYLNDNMPEDPTVAAWCADLTEDLTGVVGTIEVPGERAGVPVLIQPGYQSAATYDQVRDGQLQPCLAGTPASVFYNLAMMPGWQKWKPTYRLGEITAIDGDNCSVALDPATFSDRGSGLSPNLNINQDTTGGQVTLNDVPIEYLTCHGLAFVVGDRVLVKFTGQDWAAPKVIGFESNPTRCDMWTCLLVAVRCRYGSTYLAEDLCFYWDLQVNDFGTVPKQSNGEPHTYPAVVSDILPDFTAMGAWADVSRPELVSQDALDQSNAATERGDGTWTATPAGDEAIFYMHDNRIPADVYGSPATGVPIYPLNLASYADIVPVDQTGETVPGLVDTMLCSAGVNNTLPPYPIPPSDREIDNTASYSYSKTQLTHGIDTTKSLVWCPQAFPRDASYDPYYFYAPTGSAPPHVFNGMLYARSWQLTPLNSSGAAPDYYGFKTEFTENTSWSSEYYRYEADWGWYDDGNGGLVQKYGTSWLTRSSLWSMASSLNVLSPLGQTGSATDTEDSSAAQAAYASVITTVGYNRHQNGFVHQMGSTSLYAPTISGGAPQYQFVAVWETLVAWRQDWTHSRDWVLDKQRPGGTISQAHEEWNEDLVANLYPQAPTVGYKAKVIFGISSDPENLDPAANPVNTEMTAKINEILAYYVATYGLPSSQGHAVTESKDDFWDFEITVSEKQR